MYELKPITKHAVPAALEKALRYRLLNEPIEADSICRDVLAVDPDNQEALVTLLLAVTDQFESQFAEALAASKHVLQRLEGEYQRAYYEGIIYERWAKAQLAHGLPEEVANNWLREALRCYERAEQLSAPDDPDAILRWNACVRELDRHAKITPGTESLTDVHAGFGDDTQPR
jgi:tetratricopeptide (TPR) repeat protein